MQKAPVPSDELDPLTPASSSSLSSPTADTPTADTPAPDRNAVYEERKARLEQKRAAEEKEEREKRLARERTRRESITTPTTGADPSARRSSNTTYLEQQRKRQAAAQEDRQRVLRLLENDKIERQAKRKQSLAEDSSSRLPTTIKENTPPPLPRAPGTETAISFRLLDGSSLKAKFPSPSILGTHVRHWLDANRTDGDHPYSFLQILAPLPNKQLTISDENSSLTHLGLAPTATLVLVPAASFTTAYTAAAAAPQTGILAKAYSMLYGAITTVLAVGYPARAPPAALAPPPPPPPPPPPVPVEALPMSRTSSGNGRIRTLYDQRDEHGRADVDEARKYYNGNQVGCELLFFLSFSGVFELIGG